MIRGRLEDGTQVRLWPQTSHVILGKSLPLCGPQLVPPFGWEDLTRCHRSSPMLGFWGPHPALVNCVFMV